MFKILKKSLKYLTIFIGIAILLPTLLYLLLQIPEFQTILIRRVTNHFSSELKSTISFGHIDYKFFNKLSVNDILIKDNNDDTLLYSQNLSVVIKNIDLKKRFVRLGRVYLFKPEVSFITDTTGMMNLTWYLDLLKNTSDTSSKARSRITVDQIDIRDAEFSMINRNSVGSKNGIDFNDLRLTGINGIIEDIKNQDDTTSFNIYNLAFREKSGFIMKRMGSSVVLAKQLILFKSLFINCDSSIINLSKISLTADSSDSFRRFTREVKLDIQLEKSLISTSELKYFLPDLRDIKESIWLSGRFAGTVSELRGRNISLKYRDYTTLDCDFDFSGLPDIDNSYIYIGVNNLTTNAKDIEKIVLPKKGNIIIPEVLDNLGNVTFDGSFTGFTTDFVTYGKISTIYGKISTDVSLRPVESNRYKIKGLMNGTDINLGALTGKSDLLGKLSMQANIDGFAYSLKKFAANLTGVIDSVEINRYEYRNISLNGFFTEKTWDGSINVADKNIRLDLLGMFNFKNKLPEFDFTLNLKEANLFNLNIDKLDTTASLTMLLTSNFKGNSIDNLDGEIKLLNSNLKKYNNTLELYDFSFRTYTINNKPALSLRTDFVDADIRGNYNFAALGDLAKTTLAKLMPSQFTSVPKRPSVNKNNFSFEINFKNTDKINNFFRTGIILADKSFIRGSIFPDSIMSLTAGSGSLSIKNNVFIDLKLDANLSGSELSVMMKNSDLSLMKQTDLKGFSVGLKTKPDAFSFTVDWDNKDKLLNTGRFIAHGSISKNPANDKKTILRLDIDSTDIYARNNLWKINQSSIVIDSNSIDIDRFFISNKDHHYLVDGTVSENPSDTLHIEFRGIDISPLNYIGGQKTLNDPGRVAFNFSGQMYGKILLSNVYKDLLLESDLRVNDFSVLKSTYGSVFVKSVLDNSKKILDIKASNNLAGVKMFDINGYYDPAKKKIDLIAKASKLPVDALNPLLSFFASGITGSASGKVHFTGNKDKLVLTGALMVENTSLKVDYLQARFKMNDTVRFDKSGIKFNNIKVTDEKGQPAYINGTVYHKNFKDFTADLTINIPNSSNCLALNTKPKDNELFYGTAYGSGVTTIKTSPGSLSFDISAKTGKNTKFYIPLTSGLSVSDFSFVSFVDSTGKSGERSGDRKNLLVSAPSKQLGMDLNFDLEVTPEAEVQLIFDSKVGDIMKGHGSGNLNMTLNKKGEFRMSGDYIIEQGDYLFTLKNIFNKNFTVENGGKIMFNGDLDNAEIEMKAIYKLKTSLQPILQDEASTERIDVQCQLNLSGKLFNPTVGLNIELPNADEQTRTYLRNAISTEEELSRQFLYLLVMNSFYPESSFGNLSGIANSTNSSSSINGSSAMAVTTTEMLSNQLSNWLSQISNDFDIGFVYRPGTSELNSQEVQVALSTQLLNDKVVINGNFDYRGIGSSTTISNQLTGDFDAEVKLSEKLRMKVFNRFNDTYTGKGPYTQGIGIFYKEDFNKFSDLFRKKIKSEMKKEEETKIKDK